MKSGAKSQTLTLAPPEHIRVRKHSLEESGYIELRELKSMSVSQVDRRVYAGFTLADCAHGAS